jgi:hypothetical protein
VLEVERLIARVIIYPLFLARKGRTSEHWFAYQVEEAAPTSKKSHCDVQTGETI